MRRPRPKEGKELARSHLASWGQTQMKTQGLQIPHPGLFCRVPNNHDFLLSLTFLILYAHISPYLWNPAFLGLPILSPSCSYEVCSYKECPLRALTSVWAPKESSVQGFEEGPEWDLSTQRSPASSHTFAVSAQYSWYHQKNERRGSLSP